MLPLGLRYSFHKRPSGKAGGKEEVTQASTHRFLVLLDRQSRHSGFNRSLYY